MKISLLEWFGGPGPGLPGSGINWKGKFPRDPRIAGTDEFPYTNDAGETFSDEEIDKELELESLSLVEFYKAGKTMPGTDAMSYGKQLSSGGGFGGGKNSSGWSGAGKYPNENPEDPEEVDETSAIPTEWMNNHDDYKEFDKYFDIQEAIGIGARERATKEGGPVSTKQPWKDGLPSSKPNYTTVPDIDEEQQKRNLEDELGLSLTNTFERVQEAYLKEWADDDYQRYMSTKKAGREEVDLDFWENLENENPFYWTSDREFKKREKERKKGDE